MTCCDLSSEVTGCLQNDIERNGAVRCKRCPLAETLSDQERLKENLREPKTLPEEDYQETLI
jgi:hypothetical protein